MNLADNNIILILISLAFIYAVLSILVSILIEAVNYRSEARGKYLKKSIYKLLKDPLNNDYGYLFYNHFMIAGLKTFRFKLPQYISSSMFAEAFIDTIAGQIQHNRQITLSSIEGDSKQYAFSGEAPPGTVMDRFGQSVQQMNASPFTDLLQSFVDKSGGDYTKLKAMIEQWYNDYMDRVSGWYKSEQRVKFLVAGFVVAIALNVDSLHLLKILSLDDNMKNRLVEQAEVVADNYEAMDSTKRSNPADLNKMLIASLSDTTLKGNVALDSVSYNHLRKIILLNDSIASKASKKVTQTDSTMYILAELNLPLGWSGHEAPLSWFHCKEKPVDAAQATNSGILDYIHQRNEWGWWNLIRYLIGIVISGISLSFGAPFWFDLLVKLVNIRRSGKRPQVTAPSNNSNN